MQNMVVKSFLPMLSYFLICSCNFTGSCNNKNINRINSPDNRKSILIFLRTCGATTGFNTQVSIVDKDENTLDEGNALIFDQSDGEYGNVIASWVDSHSVTIYVPHNARIFKSRTVFPDVTITYQK